jgi:hypothetical protein
VAISFDDAIEDTALKLERSVEDGRSKVLGDGIVSAYEVAH